MAPNEPNKPADLTMPDLTGKKEGDTWTAQENGVEVTYSIPVGNGNKSVDRTWTNSDGGTSTNRMVDDGAGGLQSWTDNTNGLSAYVNKGQGGTTDEVYGLVFDPGTSTSGAPDVGFGGNANLTQVEAMRYDENGNPVALLDSSRNSRGNWDSMGVDDQGNKTLFGDLPDGKGGFIPGSLVGQISPEGYGWSTDPTGTRWNIAPDPSGDPGALLHWRTESAEDGGTLAITVDSHGVEKREHREKDTNEVLSVEFFDLDGTRTHFDVEEDTKTTFNPHDRTLTVVEHDGETTVFGDDGKVKDHKLAPGTIDLPGLIDKAIDTVGFWDPVGRGASKAGAHALIGVGGLLGWYDDYRIGRTLNLPSQRETLSGMGDMALQTGTAFLYLGGHFKDAQGNTIWSPDGKLDQTHAVLNAYNNLSILTIGTDWRDFEEKPGETIGAAIFGIGSFLVPGPKGLSALGRGARFGGIMDDVGRFGVTPHYPDLDLPDIGGSPYPHFDGDVPSPHGDMPDAEGAPQQGGNLPDLGVTPHPRAEGVEPNAPETRTPEGPRAPVMPESGPFDYPGAPFGHDPMWNQFGPKLRPGQQIPRRSDMPGAHGGAPLGGRPSATPQGGDSSKQPIPNDTAPSVKDGTPDAPEGGVNPDMAGPGIPWHGRPDETPPGHWPVGVYAGKNNRQWYRARPGGGPPEKIPMPDWATNGGRGSNKPTPPISEQRVLESATPPARDGMSQNHPDWNVENIDKDSNVRGFVGDALTRAKLRLQGYRIIAAGEKAKIPVPGKPGEFFKPDFIAVDRNGKIILVESKFNKSEYQPDQFDGYSYYAENSKQLEIDLDKNPDLLEALRRNKVDTSDLSAIVVDHVETVRWNNEWAPTDEVLRRAANDPKISGDLVDGPIKNPEWRDSALTAFSALNAEAARRSFNSADYLAAVHYQSRHQALELLRNVEPSLRALNESLMGAGAPPGPPITALRPVSARSKRPADQSLTVNIVTPAVEIRQITRAEEVQSMTYAAQL